MRFLLSLVFLNQMAFAANFIDDLEEKINDAPDELPVPAQELW
jgi:hypothetical protein